MYKKDYNTQATCMSKAIPTILVHFTFYQLLRHPLSSMNQFSSPLPCVSLTSSPKPLPFPLLSACHSRQHLRWVRRYVDVCFMHYPQYTCGDVLIALYLWLCIAPLVHVWLWIGLLYMSWVVAEGGGIARAWMIVARKTSMLLLGCYID